MSKFALLAGEKINVTQTYVGLVQNIRMTVAKLCQRNTKKEVSKRAIITAN